MAYSPDRDPYKGANNALSAPCTKMNLVTPSDSEDLAIYARALRAGSDGTIAFIPMRNEDSEVITWTVNAGDIIPCMVRRVLATGTTVTTIHALAD